MIGGFAIYREPFSIRIRLIESKALAYPIGDGGLM